MLGGAWSSLKVCCLVTQLSSCEPEAWKANTWPCLSLTLRVPRSIPFAFFFSWWARGLNSGLYSCKADTLPPEPCLQSSFGFICTLNPYSKLLSSLSRSPLHLLTSLLAHTLVPPLMANPLPLLPKFLPCLPVALGTRQKSYYGLCINFPGMTQLNKTNSVA
jgi:hypothetical protein